MPTPTKYTKSLSTDFGGSITEDILMIELNENESIAKVCVNVGRSGDVVDIYYDDALDGAEQTAQDASISSHSSVEFEPKYLEQEYEKNDILIRETWYAKKISPGNYAFKFKETLFTVVSRRLTVQSEKYFRPDGTEITEAGRTWNYLSEKSGSSEFVRKEEV